MKESFLMTTARVVVRPLFWALFWPRVEGRNNFAKLQPQKPVVLVCNHIHPIDAAAMGVLFTRNLHFLAKIELRRGKFGWLLKRLGLVFVDRDIKNGGIKAAKKYLENDMAVAIFPEGTCRADFKKSNELLPFKIGAVKMAAETGAPLMPMAISGQYRLFSRLKIRFGEPMFVAKDENLEVANEKLRDEIAKLLKKDNVNAIKLPGRPAKNPSKSPPIQDDNFVPPTNQGNTGWEVQMPETAKSAQNTAIKKPKKSARIPANNSANFVKSHRQSRRKNV